MFVCTLPRVSQIPKAISTTLPTGNYKTRAVIAISRNEKYLNWTVEIACELGSLAFLDDPVDGIVGRDWAVLYRETLLTAQRFVDVGQHGGDADQDDANADSHYSAHSAGNLLKCITYRKSPFESPFY